VSETPTFMELTPKRRARRVELVRQRLWGRLRENGFPFPVDLPLSTEADDVLRGLMRALVDHAVGDEDYKRLDAEGFARLGHDEHDEVRRRITDFALVRDVFPLQSRTAAWAEPRVLVALVEQAEERNK
jgi:hypothetical protein